MKKHKILLLICSSLMAVFLHSPPAAAINEVCTAKGAAETQSSTTQQILCRAFQEECRSIALYGAYIRKFGDTRPLSGISSAKRAHGAVLKSLLLKYGWQIPETHCQRILLFRTPSWRLTEAVWNGKRKLLRCITLF